jgi:hypothetical protein
MLGKGGHGSPCHCPSSSLSSSSSCLTSVRGLSSASSPPLCALIPVSTPRAVARGSGWGCCGDTCCCCCCRGRRGHSRRRCGCGCGCRHRRRRCLVLLPLAVSHCRRPLGLRPLVPLLSPSTPSLSVLVSACPVLWSCRRGSTSFSSQQLAAMGCW